MFEFVNEYVIEILSISIGGVSLGTILGMVIYVLKLKRDIRREIKANKAKMDEDITVTQTQVEQAFTKAVLPQRIKLDISNKIERPIKEGFLNIESNIVNKFDKILKLEKLLLAILSKFAHVKKLPQELQDEIQDCVSETETEIEL